MTVEKYLQSKFPTEKVKLISTLLVVSSVMHYKLTAFLREHNLTFEQYNVLRILRGSHPINLRVKDIGLRMIERSSNIPRLVDKLEKNELVIRVLSGVDKRESNIAITPKGIEKLATLEAPMLKLAEELVPIDENYIKDLTKSIEILI